MRSLALALSLTVFSLVAAPAFGGPLFDTALGMEAVQPTCYEFSCQPCCDTIDSDLACDDCCLACDGHGHGGHGKKDPGHGARADKHAPAGIFGEHVHERGEVMAEYKYVNMFMEDSRNGTTRLTDAQAIAAGFPVVPTQMNMEMHMIHLMYGLRDNMTVYMMLMLNANTMDHVTGMGGRFTTHNSGFGDTAFGFVTNLYKDEDTQWILKIGGTVPTGDLGRKAVTPMGNPTFPYPMRLGSGTFNFTPALTWKKKGDNGSLGSQLSANLPFGRNYRGYRVGDQFRANVWAQWLPVNKLSFSYRLEGLWVLDYEGVDPEIEGMGPYTNYAGLRAGNYINFGYGAQLLLRKGHLLNFEWVTPVYQDLDGPQLETDWVLFVSWSKAW